MPWPRRSWASMKSCAGRLKYQVGEATVDGDTATVPVEFTYVNAGTLMTEILTEYISQAWSLALSGADDEQAGCRLRGGL